MEDVLSPAATATSLERLPTLEYLDYTAGSKLAVRVDPNENRTGFRPSIELAVVKSIEPRTMSCGMLVQIREPGMPPREAFLKMFDRRLSPYFREYFNGGECHPWSPDVEEQYMDALRQQRLPVGNHQYESEDMTPEKWDRFSVAEKEHAFQQRMRKIHRDEREAYRRLEKHQGVDVPVLYASVFLGLHPPDTGKEDTNATYGHILEIRGLLIEFIHGFELLSVPSNLGYRTATHLMEQAIDIIRMIGAHGVLNYDVKLDNFMVVFDPKRGSHRVVMIDLGFCHLRHKAYTTVEWAKLKALAWDGEMNQMYIEAQRVTRKRFGNDLNVNSRSEYGFLAATEPRKPCPPGWIQVKTSRGPAFVNTQEIPCRSPICNPSRDPLHEIHKIWKRWTKQDDSSGQKKASSKEGDKKVSGNEVKKKD